MKNRACLSPLSQNFARPNGSPLVASAYKTNLRHLHASAHNASIMPDAEHPPPKETPEDPIPKAPTEITYDEYNSLADEYLEQLVSRIEGLQESRNDIDVEFAVRTSTAS